MLITNPTVLIVGAGFSGIGAAIALERTGITDFEVIEKAGSLGGTWHENTYPGCACDVPSLLYSYSFAQKPDWSHGFARQAEIEAYAQTVADEHGVSEKVRFGTELLEAVWEQDAQKWRVKTNRGTIRARAVIAATGPLHAPNIPELPGLDRFAGTVFHSAEWDHNHPLAGRRVAVVGTGASAIQFVPEIQPQVEHLTLFQRTPPWVLPKPDRRIPGFEQELYRRVPAVQRALRAGLYHSLELIQLAQRHPEVMRQIERIGRLHLRLSVRDPELRAKLTPSFRLGCKRMLLSNNYYPALTQPNVSVIAAGLREVSKHSVIDAHGAEHRVDTIILGTGFHATDAPIAQLIHGADGRSLADRWAGSPRAYLGTTVAGAPNLFLMIGPNLGNGHSSAIVLIEAQLRYITDALGTMERERIGSIEISPRAELEYNERVQKALAGTVWNAGGCSSYYLDANGSNSAIYPWTTIDLRRRTNRFDASDYKTTAAVESRVAA